MNVSFAVEWDVDASVTYQWYHPNATVFTEDAKTLLLKRKMIDRAIDLSEVKEVPPVFVESLKAADVIFPDTRDGDPVSADEAEEEEEEEESWEDEPDKEWEVKKILAHGFLQDGGIMYLLEWEDWDEPTVCHTFPSSYIHARTSTNFTNVSQNSGRVRIICAIVRTWWKSTIWQTQCHFLAKKQQMPHLVKNTKNLCHYQRQNEREAQPHGNEQKSMTQSMMSVKCLE